MLSLIRSSTQCHALVPRRILLIKMSYYIQAADSLGVGRLYVHWAERDGHLYLSCPSPQAIVAWGARRPAVWRADGGAFRRIVPSRL